MTIDQTAQDLLQLVIDTASGKQTKAEINGFRDISIFKDGRGAVKAEKREGPCQKAWPFF